MREWRKKGATTTTTTMTNNNNTKNAFLFFSFLFLLIFIALPTSNIVVWCRKCSGSSSSSCHFFLFLFFFFSCNWTSANWPLLSPRTAAFSHLLQQVSLSLFPFFLSFFPSLFLLCRSDIRTDICKWVFLLISNFFSFFLFLSFSPLPAPEQWSTVVPLGGQCPRWPGRRRMGKRSANLQVKEKDTIFCCCRGSLVGYTVVKLLFLYRLLF